MGGVRGMVRDFLVVGGAHGWVQLLLRLIRPSSAWWHPAPGGAVPEQRATSGGGCLPVRGSALEGESASYRRHLPRAGGGVSSWCWVRGSQPIVLALVGTAGP